MPLRPEGDAVKHVFHHTRAQRSALWLALFAILLILVAPLISTALQKDPMSAMPGMHHEMSMPMPAQSDHAHHDRSHHAMSQPESPPPAMPLDHAEACGYCVLLAHVPGLIFLLVLLLLGRVLRVTCRPARTRPRLWHFIPWLWPDTRAPPSLRFS
ncbi:DUF2946 domain-containing protein [Kosakonia cowanii]|uniref:DUF2946 domain-containing protein n=1 Tax=Kosakonia cowanii TaxID=208223 RepID=UPI00289CA24A|nr:DUF2946 domain-containing protein [Kosakonia cowanii]